MLSFKSELVVNFIGDDVSAIFPADISDFHKLITVECVTSWV